MSKTVTVEWTRRHYIPKYERYEKRRTRVKAHNPDEIDAQVGDIVTIKETRPLSKTKNFIIIKKNADAEAETSEAPVKEEVPAAKTVKKTVKKTIKKAAPVKEESDDS